MSHAIANQSLEAYNEVYRADTLWRLGRYREAEDCLKKAVERSSRNKPLIATVFTAQAGLDLSRRSFPAAEGDIRKMTEAAGAGSEVVSKRLLGLVRIGTQAAVEYVCSRMSVEQLLKRVRRSGAEMMPFEAVIQVSVSRGVPVSSQLVGVHMRTP